MLLGPNFSHVNLFMFTVDILLIHILLRNLDPCSSLLLASIYSHVTTSRACPLQMYSTCELVYLHCWHLANSCTVEEFGSIFLSCIGFYSHMTTTQTCPLQLYFNFIAVGDLCDCEGWWHLSCLLKFTWPRRFDSFVSGS